MYHDCGGHTTELSPLAKIQQNLKRVDFTVYK